MTVTETMPAMEASSLRALALSTLKSKRRKPAPTAQMPAPPLSRPPPPPVLSVDTMQLDYGEGEPSARTAVEPQSSHQDSAPPIMRDVVMREEGEISSDEEAASKRDSTLTDSAKSTPRLAMQTLPASASPTTSVRNGGLSLLDRITDAPHVLPTAPESSIPLSERISSPPVPVSAPAQPRAIHKNQVRPNVFLDQAGYDAAKDHLLDILGYGVPPEDLLGLGLSREFLYYAFTELKLRLPANLDTTGLFPYNPSTVREFSFIEPAPSPALRDRIQGAPLPSTSAVSFEAQQDASSAPMEDLNDMEILKRKELQARKAVLATRKRKLNSKPSPPKVQADVEDFLKALEATTTPISTQPSPIPMQVDEPQPAHASPKVPVLSPSNEPPPATPAEVASAEVLPKEATPTADTPTELTLPSYESAVQTPVEAAPSSTDSMTVTFKSALQFSPNVSPVAPVAQYPPRRSLKRPVASDFVDVDGAPSADYWITSYDTTQSGQRKRAATTFLNVKQPRTIIDLSDSEGDDDEDEGERHPASTSRTLPPSRANGLSRAGPSSGAITPAVLQEKELEILKMRERIAEMERQKLLKKLGLKSGSSNVNGARRSPSVNTQLPPASSYPQTSPSSLATPTTAFVATTPDVSQSPVTPDQTFSQSKTPEPISVDQSEEQSPVATVDVDAEMSSSAQAPHSTEATTTDHLEDRDVDMPAEAQLENPAAYDSLFASYPALRLSLQPSLAGAWPAVAESAPLSKLSVLQRLDLKPLRERAWKKSIDPNSVLCQYEFPGGGVCRDASCEDIHLSKLSDGAELSDHDTAEYICSAVAGLDFDTTLKALQEETTDNPNASLEDRVTGVLASRLSEHRPTT